VRAEDRIERGFVTRPYTIFQLLVDHRVAGCSGVRLIKEI
jgi:hypothetical protein